MLDKRYYINVGKEGSFLPSGDTTYDTSPQDIDQIFTGFRQDPPAKIVVYFHGGLVKLEEGMATATDFTNEVLKKTDAYPISFVWETGLIETITQDFDSISKSRLFKKLLEKIIKIAAKKMGIDFDLSSLGVRGSESLTYTEIQNELDQEFPFEHYDFKDGSRGLIGDPTDEQLQEEIEVELEYEMEADSDLLELFKKGKSTEERKNLNMAVLADEKEERSRGIISTALALKPLVKIVFRIIKRHVKNRDHGFYPTVIEEFLREFYVADLGASIWSSMKKKAKLMWEDLIEYETPLHQRAGNYLLNKLDVLINDFPNVKIDLVGHSAGSIIICHLLQNVYNRRLPLRFNKIIFLAPACHCDLFKESILDYEDAFDYFRMFTMTDLWERKDSLVPYLYTRSLLYLVSGALEGDGEGFDEPILGLQRHHRYNEHYDGIPSIKAIDDYFSAHPKNIVYSVTSEDADIGFRSESAKHGAFNNIGEVTMDSVIYLIKEL